MPDHKKRPVALDVTEADEYYQGVWRKAKVEWRSLDDYYHRRYPLWPKELKEDREVYRPSTPTNIIDHASNVQLAFDPHIHREPVGNSDAHKTSADSLEVGLHAVLEDCTLNDATLTWKQVGRHLVHYGYSPVEGPVLNYEDRPVLGDQGPEESDDDFTERRTIHGAKMRDWNPVRIRAIHPSHVLMDPMEKQPKLAIKHETFIATNLHELSVTKKRRSRSRYFSELNMAGRGNYDPIDVVHYWTAHYHAVMTNDHKQVLWVEKNTYGFVPFAHAFSGFGMVPTGEDFDPVYLAVGLLNPIRDSIKLQAQSAAAKHTLHMRAAYTSLGTSKDPFELAKEMADAGIVQGEEGDFFLMPTPQVAGWMNEVGREVTGDIEQGSYPKPLGGFREPGVTTVGQQAILSNAGNRTFAGPTKQMAHLATVTTSRILRLVELLGEPIGVAGRMVKPSDIYNTHSVKVTFENLDPVFELQRREMGIREYQIGLKSDETYWEQDARLENVAQERDRLDEQRVRNDPEIARLRALEAARRLDLGDEAEVAFTGEQEAAQRDGRRNEEPPRIIENPIEDAGRFTDVNSPRGPESAARELRQPLTERVAKPGRL